MRAILLFLAMMAVQPAYAAEINGVHLDDAIQSGSGKLLLNGGGVRTKLFFDIYVAGLYLPQPANRGEQVLAMPGAKRLLMHFTYGEVSREKLVAAWEEGFAKNQSAAALKGLRARIDRFNGLFPAVLKRGDRLLLDFLPDGSTQLILNGAVLGTLPGEDFQRALLSIWLGQHPADSDLKAALLGND